MPAGKRKRGLLRGLWRSDDAIEGTSFVMLISHCRLPSIGDATVLPTGLLRVAAVPPTRLPPSVVHSGVSLCVLRGCFRGGSNTQGSAAGLVAQSLFAHGLVHAVGPLVRNCCLAT